MNCVAGASAFSRIVKLISVGCLLCVAACTPQGRPNSAATGALTGGALGAGLGAVVGNQVGDTGAGVAIGSAFGALSGGLIGNQFDQQDRELGQRDELLRRQQRQIEENRRLLEELRRYGADARPTDRGISINLPDVLFELDSSKLRPASRRKVRQIANSIKESVRYRPVAVEGHTDSSGTVSYNRRLSLQRARAVANALVEDGLSPRQIAARGFGESRPVASNSDEPGRARNRRVEVIIENYDR